VEPFVDISEDQGVYNMAGNNDQLIAIRMSTGVLNRFDTQAATNYANASAAGKKIIQYHYCGNNDPTAEANLFISACSPFAQYDMYCIDAELGQSKAWKQTFADVVKAATGCNVIDYMNISTTNNLGVLPDCGLWLAAPSWGFNQIITELNPGIEYIMQQGPIVNGVDSDMCFIPMDVLEKYGYTVPNAPTPTPTPEPTPTPPAPQPDPTPVPTPTPEPPTPAPVPPTPPTPSPTPEPSPAPAPKPTLPKLNIFQIIIDAILRWWKKG
jgi:hypothetical protein